MLLDGSVVRGAGLLTSAQPAQQVGARGMEGVIPGKLVLSHGELDLPNGCFLRIAIPSRIHTYAPGLSLHRLARDSLSAVGISHLPAG